MSDAPARPLRLATVSYLNARPLVHGLDRDAAIELIRDVPSRLAAMLRDGRADVALLPTIDYQRIDGLSVIPAGGIGCDGPTLTVRIFSKVPLDRIDTLACDADSHTSIALAEIVLHARHGRRPRLVPLDHRCGDVPARLLIGDKVVCEEPIGFEHQLDLGAAWKDLTGLPFVFAVWACREGAPLGDLPARLEAARLAGLRDVAEIVTRHATPRGWPAGIALQYLTLYLRYEIGARQLEAMRRFHAMACDLGLVASPPRPLRLVESDCAASAARA